MIFGNNSDGLNNVPTLCCSFTAN